MRPRRILTRSDVSPTLVSAGLWLLCVVVGLVVLLVATLAYADGGTAQEVATAAGGWTSTGALGLVAYTLWRVMGKVDRELDNRAADREVEAKHRAAIAAHHGKVEAHHEREEHALDEVLSAVPGAKRRPTGERISAVESEVSAIHAKLDMILAGEHTGPIHVARRQP